jgi:PAS domain S-box-containing protein
LLAELLEKEGYQVRPAERAQTAIDSALAKPPGLILLDVRMPEMDGFELCRRLRQDKRTRHVPIIFVSALKDIESKIKGFEAGGVDFISKPFQELEILARVRTHMHLHRMQQHLEQLVDERTSELRESRASLEQKVRELQKSEERLSLIYDSVADILYYIRVEPDDCFRFLSINHVFLKATGLTRDQIVGKRIEEVIPETSVRLVLDNYKKAIKENRIVRWEETSVYPAGEKIGDVSIAPVLNKKGICTHLVGSVHDVTERKQAEQTLRETELRYRTVADFTYDWENWTNVDDTLEYVSPSCERISGYSVQDFMENTSLFREIIVPEDRGIWDQHVCDSQEALTLSEVQFRIKSKDGKIRWIEHACRPVNDHQGNITSFRASNRDITIRKQTEKTLQTSRKKAMELATKLISSQEAGSARIARELHDDIIQRLAFSKIEVDKLEMKNESLPEPVKNSLRQIGRDLGVLSSDIHMISRRIHPITLEILGLVRSMENECKNFTRLKEIPVTLDLDGALQYPSKEISLCTYRILQEGLRNIVRHAKATGVHVTLSKKNDTLHLLIKDNGIGFDPASDKITFGLGIASMTERAHLIRGDLSIESQPGKGTAIKLAVPLESRNEV